MDGKIIIKRILLTIAIGILLYFLLTNLYYPITLTHIFNICFIICFIIMLITQHSIIYIITGIVYLLFACKNFFSNADAIVANKMVIELMTYVVSCILMGIAMIMMGLQRKKLTMIILLSILTIIFRVLSAILQARTSLGLIINQIPFTVAMLMPAVIAIIECKKKCQIK